MTTTQAELTATDAGLLLARQEHSLTLGPSAADRLLARGRIRGALAMLGPAFVASVAYVDPGNFATNLQGGARCGYLLLWVVLAANLMAMVVQYLSAKLGIVTGRALPELVRDRLPRPATWGMWVQGEVVAMATDVAEFIGAALGLNLLFGVPMLSAGLITGLITFAVLGLRARGRRRFEVAIIALLGFVAARAFHTPALAGLDTIGQAHAALGRLAGGGAALVFAVALLALRRLLIQRRHLRGRGHHGRLRPAPGPAASPPGGHHAPGAGDPGGRRQPHQRPGAQSGRAVLRHPVRAGAARHSNHRRDVMGCHVNQRRTIIAGGMCVAVIIALNVLLLCQQFFQS